MTATEKAQALIRTRSDAELLNDWDLIDSRKGSEEVYMVRGWLMDEIERRWPVEYNEWLDSCHIRDNVRDYIKQVYVTA